MEHLNGTTYEVELFGKDKVEIGDRESANFKPHIKLNRWGGECFIKVSLPITERSLPIIDGDRITWEGRDRHIIMYPLAPTEQFELGSYEYEIVLEKKPRSNKIVLNIESQGLKFFYQPPLTQQEVDEGAVRPDNIVGSYAVYHATRTNMHRSQADADKYKAGKAFHIFRPRIEDANGNWVWGELHYDEQAGTLTTTIPQDFLDTAIYPIRHAAGETFGYTTKGASAGDPFYGGLQANQNTMPEDGTADSMSFYIKHSFNSADNNWFVIYSDTGADYPNNVVAETNSFLIANAFDNWKTVDFIGSPSLISGTKYWLTGIANYGATAGNGNIYYYDSGGVRYYDSLAQASIPDPFPGGKVSSSRKQSVYCTYTPSGLTQAVGGGSIAIAGTLNLKTMISVGSGSIAIAGALTSVLTFFKTVGGGSISISGTLNRLIKIGVGAGSITIAGALGRLTKIAVGAGSVAIAGTLGRLIKLAVGSGSVTMVGSLVASLAGLIRQAVGGGSVAISGTLGRLIKINVGGGAVAMAGALVFTINRLLRIFSVIASALKITPSTANPLTIVSSIGTALTIKSTIEVH